MCGRFWTSPGISGIQGGQTYLTTITFNEQSISLPRSPYGLGSVTVTMWFPEASRLAFLQPWPGSQHQKEGCRWAASASGPRLARESSTGTAVRLGLLPWSGIVHQLPLLWLWTLGIATASTTMTARMAAKMERRFILFGAKRRCRIAIWPESWGIDNARQRIWFIAVRTRRATPRRPFIMAKVNLLQVVRCSVELPKRPPNRVLNKDITESRE
ncbi:hypothetical protein VTN02DRAFT_663 [Thermoascus thermophilus]